MIGYTAPEEIWMKEESIRKRSKKKNKNISTQTSRNLRLPDEKPVSSKHQGKKRRKTRRKKRESIPKLSKLRLHFSNRRLNFDKQRIAKFLFLSAEIGLVGMLAYALVLFYGQRVSNAGDSMSPLLKNGDVVLVDRLIYNAVKPMRGDVIVFNPGGNENAHYLIKRVAGLPGETVQIADGKIYINEKECTEGIYVSDVQSAGIAAEPVELGEGEYFVIGDNHAGSDDSRTPDVGNVRRRDIYGKAWFVVSFGDNFGRIKD